MPQTVRIDPAAHAVLAELARALHIPRTEALSRAIEAYRREVFLDGLAADFAALRANVGAWGDERVEREGWESTDGDGLANE